MPNDELNPDSSVPANAEGESNGSSAGESVALKDLLSEAVGRNYSSDEEALAAVKETFSYVGKKKEDIAKELSSVQKPTVDPSQYVSKREFEDALFLSKNSEYESPEIKSLLNGLRGEGQSLNDVANSDTFKSIYSKIKATDEIANEKSILHSNPRIGKASSALDEAKEAASKGDFSTAGDKAVKAVIESLEL